MIAIYKAYYTSPAGKLLLAEYDGELCLCLWANDCHEKVIAKLEHQLNTLSTLNKTSILTEAIQQLDEYFAGNRQSFDLPLRIITTDFRQAICHLLQEIPFGQTESYMALAQLFGNTKAIRAVASACGANPISIFIPCHRIIGSNGKLTGYNGGLEAKKILLDLERTLGETRQNTLF